MEGFWASGIPGKLAGRPDINGFIKFSCGLEQPRPQCVRWWFHGCPSGSCGVVCKVIVAGGKIDRIEADGEIRHCISNFSVYLRRRGSTDELLQEWNLLSKKELDEKDDRGPHFENLLNYSPSGSCIVYKKLYAPLWSQAGRKWVCKHVGLWGRLACISSIVFVNIGVSRKHREWFFSGFYFKWLSKGRDETVRLEFIVAVFTCWPHYVVIPVSFLKRWFWCFQILSF